MNKSIGKVLPVLFGFFVMGFCDVVGISTSYVKADFGLSETLAGFIPSMVFLWFLLLSVPTAMAMNRLGRKTMVQISNDNDCRHARSVRVLRVRLLYGGLCPAGNRQYDHPGCTQSAVGQCGQGRCPDQFADRGAGC